MSSRLSSKSQSASEFLLRSEMLKSIVQLPEEVDKYFTVVSVLGEGSFGRAVKVLKKDNGSIKHIPRYSAMKIIEFNPLYMSMVKRELGVIKSLKSRHIAKYYGAYMDSKTKTIRLFMELVSGFGLDNPPTDLTVEQKNKIANGMLKGMRYIHSQGIVHSDVKPENIMVSVSPSGNMTSKFIDFGLAYDKQTDSNEFQGSLVYSWIYYILKFPTVKGSHAVHAMNKVNDWWGLMLTTLCLFKVKKFEYSCNVGAMKVFCLQFTHVQSIPKLDPVLLSAWSDNDFLNPCYKKENFPLKNIVSQVLPRKGLGGELLKVFKLLMLLLPRAYELLSFEDNKTLHPVLSDSEFLLRLVQELGRN
jgi:serine/threonine protein kinase